MMKVIWAPWRMVYLAAPSRKGKRCIFCPGIKSKNDSENLIVWRGKKVSIFLNRFPYNNGHLMVVPNRHLAELSDLSEEEILEIHLMLQLSISALRKVMKPQGFNLGLNLGKVAGAGVPGHLHWHIVPRWQGDTNFMPVIADIKVMPEHLNSTYQRLKSAFKLLTEK